MRRKLIDYLPKSIRGNEVYQFKNDCIATKIKVAVRDEAELLLEELIDGKEFLLRTDKGEQLEAFVRGVKAPYLEHDQYHFAVCYCPK